MRFDIIAFKFDPLMFYLEIFSILIILISSFLIYYSTKEIYQLTDHKGIKFFRNGFLFFGFAQIINLLIQLFRPNIFRVDFLFMKYLFVLFSILNLISILYLISSLFTKKIKEYYIYVLTFIVFLINILFEERKFVIIYSTVLFFALGIISFIKFRKKKHKFFSQIYLIYILLFLFWIITFIGRIITHIYDISKIYILIFSASIMLYILFRVYNKLNFK